MFIHKEHYRFAIVIELEDQLTEGLLVIKAFDEITAELFWDVDFLVDTAILYRKFGAYTL